MNTSDLNQLNEYFQQECPGPYTIIVEDNEIIIKPNESPEGFLWFLTSNL